MQRARQALFLRTNGIRLYLGTHGWQVVLCSAVEPSESKNHRSRVEIKQGSITRDHLFSLTQTLPGP
ncbi:hypothetical protein [Xanthomonas sacchari]|uniref:hypothetical protein n=1 Tax=Xanthomonas sacchari TaxID=56458 RepID=UPI003D2F594A